MDNFNCDVLNEDERDTLQELMNIAYGSATSAISEILDSYATLSIPNIQILNNKGLEKYIENKIEGEKIFYFCTQMTNGKIAGENMFLIDGDSAKNLSDKFEIDISDNENDLFDILLEITNILSSSTLSQFAGALNSTISFSPPAIKKIKNMYEFNDNIITDYNKVIIISTLLTFEDSKIEGELLILTSDSSIEFIKQRIQEILESYYD